MVVEPLYHKERSPLTPKASAVRKAEPTFKPERILSNNYVKGSFLLMFKSFGTNPIEFLKFEFSHL